MKTKILLALILSAGVLFGGTPIDNLKFGTNVDGNNKAITNLSALQLGGVTITNWNTASSDGGSLTNLSVTESDPKWSAVSNSITTKADNGQTAYGWGNHATNGYLTAESDPIWSIVSNSITTKANNGQTAFSWGNHATNGYLKSESDPKWAAVSNSITTKANNGQTAYGWGNHATNGYLKSESDTLDSVMSRGSTITGSGAKGMTRSSGAVNSFYIKMDTGGEDSWLEIGYPSISGTNWFGNNAIIIVAHGGTKPIYLRGSKFDWNQGEFTLYDNGNIDGHNAVWSNATINANNYQWNGTNLVNWRQGSIGGTASVYFVINGTNYHIRVE